MVWCEYHIKKHHIVEQGQYHTLATLLKVLSVRSILLSTPPRLNTRSITDPTFNKLESHTSFSEENPAKRGEVEYLQWGLRILVAAVLKMNIHAYDMLNLEGPRQKFGGKTAMVTMAKNFSSKRGMQYLEHPPDHHLAPWELQTHWFLQDICCNLPSMKAIPSCASLHLTGSYLAGFCHLFHGGAIYPYLSISIHHNFREHLESGELYGQRLEGRRHRDDSTAVPGGQVTWNTNSACRNVQKGKLFTTFCSTRHVFLKRAGFLWSFNLEFGPATKPFKFLTSRFH